MGARESSCSGFSPAVGALRVVTIEQPLSGVHRDLLIAHGRRHVDAVSDAVRVGDDDARPVVGLRFQEGLERVLIFRAHRDAGDVDVAVGHRHHAEILLRSGLAAGGELRNCGARSGLRSLTAGVGINLGVEHEDVHVASAGQDVIEAAVADVVGPAVATDDPDALLHQHVGYG